MRNLIFTSLVAFGLGAPLVNAQDHDPNGPNIAVIETLPDGGIRLTGEFIARRNFNKLVGWKFREKYGYPVALGRVKGTLSAITGGSLDHIDRKLGGDGVVENPVGEIELFDRPERSNYRFAFDVEVFDAEDSGQKSQSIDLDETVTPKKPEVHELGPEKRPIDLETVSELNAPVDLFANDTGNGIALLSGNWRSVYDGTEVTGCPPGVGEAAATRAAAGWAANVVFDDSGWHPSDFPTDLKSLSWARVSTNGYVSRPFEQSVEGSGMGLTVTMAMRASAPDNVVVWGRINLRLSAALAQISGGSQNCNAIIRGRYVRQN